MDSPIPLFLLLFSFSLLFLVSGNPFDFYSSCTNLFNCGDITHVGFPFWGDGRPAACGHPALKLTCEGSNTTIVIKEVKYQILKFSAQKNSPTLTIARADYMASLCPNKFINTTIDYNLFDTINPGYRNITLIYCSSSPIGPVAPQFSCPDYNFGMIQVGAAGPGLCNASVIMPISFDSLVSDVVNSNEILKAINEGFEVRLKEDGDGCGICAASKGICGYDLSSNQTTCYCPDGAPSDNGACRTYPAGGGGGGGPASPPGDQNRTKLKVVIGVCVGLGSVVVLLCNMIIYIRRRRRLSIKTLSTPKSKRMDIESIINYGPKRYHYSEIKKITNSFSNKVGEGGYGTVYRGKLVDGTVVAIKVLKVSKGNGEDFKNEVMSISRTSHVNIVSLLGFSYNTKKIALVYEFMVNGSLDRFMPRSCDLEMKMLHKIVLGVARGLEYLHCGCSTRIVHFDIKPQNILLDEDFNPKISDFGLAKLCKRKESAISMLGTRGTAGFIAPEVFSRAFGVVSYKSDVYSYEMLVLDLVLGGIRNPNSSLLSDESEMYFPNWIFKKFETIKTTRMDQSLLEEDEEMERKMVMIGLWCIQTSPLDRPSMSRVLEMLEGSIHSLQMPPRPSLIPSNMSTQQSTSESISYEII